MPLNEVNFTWDHEFLDEILSLALEKAHESVTLTCGSAREAKLFRQAFYKHRLKHARGLNLIVKVALNKVTIIQPLLPTFKEILTNDQP